MSQNWIYEDLTKTDVVIPFHLFIAVLFGWVERQRLWLLENSIGASDGVCKPKAV